MKEEIISLETARLAKKVGFDLPVEKYYENKSLHRSSNGYMDYNNEHWEESISIEWFSAPTQTTLQRWLREKHKIYLHVAPDYVVGGRAEPKWIFKYPTYKECYGVKIHINNHYFHPERYETPEIALEEGFPVVLELINQ